MKFYTVKKISKTWEETLIDRLFEKKADAETHAKYLRKIETDNFEYAIEKYKIDINELQNLCDGNLPYVIVNKIKLTEK